MRKLFMSSLCLLCTGVMFADSLSPEAALSRVYGSGARRAPGAGAQPTLTLTRNTADGNPAVYVFSNPQDRGYLVVSADDMAVPLLGYADEGTFETGELNPALEWWLGEYTRQIEYAAANGVKTSSFAMPTTRADWQPIEPLITSHWDQGKPYHNQCPLVGPDRTFTGCVATALAQVMNYWKYPEVGRGTVSYDAESISKRLTLNFGSRKFDWDNMLPEYRDGQYTDTQAAAVAYLMKACGYAVKMDYGLDSSGALAMNIVSALKRYFDYDPNMVYTLRQYHSASEWAKLIYENLRDVGPLMYGGGSLLGGGHSFVCDGYDGNGYFHFNWGWTGMSNGYYLLDALNPESLGTGGGGGGGYNFTQDIVLGIQPPTGKPEIEQPLRLTQQGSLAGFIENDILYFDLFAEGGAMWVNYNPVNIKVGFGAIFEPQGKTAGDVKQIIVSPQRYDITPGYGTDPSHLKPQVVLADAGLSDGTYKVVFATFNPEDETEPWRPIRENHGYFNYITLTKSGDKYDVVVNDVAGIGITKAEIVGRLIDGCPTTFKVEVANISDIEITRGIAPVFIYDNAMAFLGESIMVTVGPGETVTREWTTELYPLQGAPGIGGDTELLFTFFDEMTYLSYDDDFIKRVTMQANPGPPTITAWAGVGPKIKNVKSVKEEFHGKEIDVYQVEDRKNIQVLAYVGMEKGYFQYPMISAICREDPDKPGYLQLMTYAAKQMTIEETNQRTRFDITIDFSEGVENELYYIMTGFGYNGEIYQIDSPLGYFRIVDPNAAVEGVGVDGTLSLVYDKAAHAVNAIGEARVVRIEAYDLSGRCVARSAGDSLDLTGVSAGVLTVRALDAEGNSATVKVVR